MDIYEALDKLKQNKRIDRTARRKQLVEKRLSEGSGKKPVRKLNEYREPAEVWSPLKNYLFNMICDLHRDGKINIREGVTMTEFEAVVDEICDKLGTLLSDEKNESLSEATHRYATKWAVVKLGYYDNGKGNGGLLYDKKKDEIVKEFEGEGKGSTADNDAYNKAKELADKLNKKEGKLSNGKNRYEAKPMNTKTTKL